MKVSGKDIAQRILDSLKKEIAGKNLSPNLAIILANNSEASKIYIAKKREAAQNIGIKATLFEFLENEKKECLEEIQRLNSNPKVNGIIIQQPMHQGFDAKEFIYSVAPQKDVDGFLEDSPFTEATALAVLEMLSEFALLEGFNSTEEFLKDKQSLPFSNEKLKKIVILGKGLTAGRPTINLLTKIGFPPTIIDSKTKNPNEIIKNADIVISATGRKNIVNKSNVKKGAYVIGIGVGKEEIEGEKKIYGDINEEEIKDIAKLYCPTIGGIGPLTVACLLRNVVEASQKS